MKNKGAAFLTGLLAATMVDTERKDFYEITNPYDGLDGLTYRGLGQKGYLKTPLTNKQKKARAKAKRAKKARKRGRK
jgi:hypothetical protein